jgi:hypothetical protein
MKFRVVCNGMRLIRHAGRWVLGLGEHDSGAEVFAQHYGQLVST